MQHPIGDHALLADGRTAALVDPDGNVAWLCWPRVDSPPCLLSILDDALGGVFSVAPASRHATVLRRVYRAGTLILRTVWQAGGAELTVDDALACDGAPRLVRAVRASGPVDVAVRVRLAPDAARARASVSADVAVLRVRGGGLDVAVTSPAPWSVDGDGVATSTITAGPQQQAVVLTGAGDGDGSSLEGTQRWFAERVAGEIAPSQRAAQVLGTEPARALLVQSAAVLAGLRQRGGGIVAAPTSSLPQWPRSTRTWDYRYSWLRDTALAGLAMVRCGMDGEAAGLGDFIGEATRSLPPAVLRRVDGTAPPPEEALPHLRGYGGAAPVRLGNAASDQAQLDVAGEVLELAAALAGRGLLRQSLAEGSRRLADWTAAHWAEPDHGIWEIRGAPRRYTHSRVMAWAGLEQAASLAETGVIAGDSAAWRSAAGSIRKSVLDTDRGPLTLTDRGGGPDAALAQAALVGFLGPSDPRLHATLDGIVSELDRGGLIDRHRPSEDESSEPCGPFLFPTFWLAEALERCGRDGSRHLAAATSARGALGLFGEVADPRDGSPLGNYPQVQSHAAFILTATDEPTGAS